MAAYDLEEQEQLSAIKAWWEQHGNLVTWIVLVVVLAIAAVLGWRGYQMRQAAEAGSLYGGLMQAVEKKDAVKVRQFSGELIAKHEGVTASELGALLAAKNETEAGDVKSAALKLDWVVKNSKDAGLRDIARLHLAAAQVEQKALDDALKTLEAAPGESFVARFEDMRGDILAAKGASKEAREAYKRALDAVAKAANAGNGSPFKSTIETKLESLGGA